MMKCEWRMNREKSWNKLIGWNMFSMSNICVGYCIGVFTLVGVLLFAGDADAALLGVDLGSEFLKVSLVKPGKIPISIAVNSMTKRKTPAVFGVVKGDRLLGEEAAAIVPRYPEKILFNARELVGVPFSHDLEKELFAKHGMKYEFDREGSMYASWKSENGTTYNAVELLSNILYQAKQIGELNAGEPIKDAVISVPSYFGQSQLQSVATAADIAGMNVMALTTDHAAAALQYGIDRNFKNNTQNIVFYDMGATGVSVSLIEFSTYAGSDRGVKRDIGQFVVKGVKWDSTLGSSNLEAILMNHFVDEFHSKYKVDVDIRTIPRAMAKLRKNLKKLKEVLSANKDAFLSVQSIYEEIDFSSKITRETFEEIAGDFWERAIIPLEELLKESNLDISEISGVELVGGCTRVPKLQQSLNEFLFRSPDKHLDASEAIALGSGFKAANISTSFRVRKFGGIDINPYAIQFSTFPLEDSDKDFVPLTKMIAGKWKQNNHPKTFAVANATNDFGIKLEYADELPPGITTSEIASYNITGVAEKISKFNQTGPHEIAVKFGWKLESILYVEKATVAVKVIETIEVKKPKNQTKSEEIKEEAKESEKGGEENKESGEKDENKDEVSENSQGDDEMEEEIEYQEKEVLKRILLKVSDAKEMYPQPTSSEHRAYKQRMKSWQVHDDLKEAQAKAKNDFESYIIAKRELLNDESAENVTTEDQRDSYRNQLMEAEDWLYEDGDNAPVDVYKEKLKELAKEGDAIEVRIKEWNARPVAIENANKAISSAKGKLGEWNRDKPWLSDANKSKMTDALNALSHFMEEKTEKQNSTPNHEMPIFTASEVEDLIAQLEKEIAKVEKLKKPKPKKLEKKESEETKEDEDSESDDGKDGKDDKKEDKEETEEEQDADSKTEEERANEEEVMDEEESQNVESENTNGSTGDGEL